MAFGHARPHGAAADRRAPDPRRGTHPGTCGARALVDPDSMVSSTRNLDRFFHALLGGPLLRPAQLAEMKRTVEINEDINAIWPRGLHGLGLVSRPLPCGGVYQGHDGGYITVTGVTDDGRRSAVVSMSTSLGDSLNSLLEQQRDADTLIKTLYATAMRALAPVAQGSGVAGRSGQLGNENSPGAAALIASESKSL
ncbi:serine hydrolase [Micromonospora sp. NPDC005161]